MATMDNADKAMSWPAEEFLESTSDPNMVIGEDVPTLTITTIIGMSAVMIFAIAAVFVLGVLIDCRQQRLIEKQIGEAKRLKNHRRVNVHPEDDSTSIAHNMEEQATSDAPAESLRHIP